MDNVRIQANVLEEKKIDDDGRGLTSGRWQR